MTTPISGNPIAQTICNTYNTNPLIGGDIQYMEGSRPSASMIKASLPTGPDTSVYEMPCGKVEDPFSPAALSALASVADFFKLQDMQGPGEVPDNIHRPELARQLSLSAVDLIAGEENQIDSHNGDRQLAVEFYAEAYLDLHDDFSRTEFFRGNDDAETSLSAKNAMLKTAAEFLHEDFNSDEISSAARQLRQWSKENDIGLEILRMFVATWNQIRNTLRVERQMQIAEIRQLSDKAVAALIQQGKDKFMQDALNAWASIASSVVQLAPIGIHAAHKRISNQNQKTLMKNLTKNAEAGNTAEAKANNRHAKATNFNNVILMSRAFGEGVQGIINFCAAYKGLDAAYDNADYTRYSNRMQAENIELENLNARGEAAWQNMLQILANISERQNRLYEANIRIAHV